MILITGATGAVGRPLAAALRERGLSSRSIGDACHAFADVAKTHGVSAAFAAAPR
jgi:nucleoside-diphosphate-sugar epimerase